MSLLMAAIASATASWTTTLPLFSEKSTMLRHSGCVLSTVRTSSIEILLAMT